jgi:predicted Zn-dependent protease
MYDRQYQEAVALMNVLESENVLSSNLKKIKKSLESRKDVKPLEEDEEEEELADIDSLKNQFETEKSYQILEQILEIYKENPTELVKYSEEGISLFPAQPFVYLTKAKVLNNKKEYKNALTTLQNGIDFVIEDKMEADFYTEIAKSYKGLGNLKEQNKYQQKANKLKSE